MDEYTLTDQQSVLRGDCFISHRVAIGKKTISEISSTQDVEKKVNSRL